MELAFPCNSLAFLVFYAFHCMPLPSQHCTEKCSLHNIPDCALPGESFPLGCSWLFNNKAYIGPLKEIGIHSANVMCSLANIRFLLMSKQAFPRPLQVTQFQRRMRQRKRTELISTLINDILLISIYWLKKYVSICIKCYCRHKACHSKCSLCFMEYFSGETEYK